MAQSFIAGIFGHSPVRPLQQHMAKVMECVHQAHALSIGSGFQVRSKLSQCCARNIAARYGCVRCV